MTHKYLAHKAPKFRIRVEIKNEDGDTEDVNCWFENGIYSTDDDKVAEVLDKLLIKTPTLNLHFKKADMEEAAAMVAQHRKSLKKRAHAGSFSSESLEQAKRGVVHASGNAMEESAPNNPEMLATLQEAMSSESNQESATDTVVVTEQKTTLDGSPTKSSLKF